MTKRWRSESFSPLVSSQFSKAPRARQEASVSSKPLPYWGRVSVTNNHHHSTQPLLLSAVSSEQQDKVLRTQTEAGEQPGTLEEWASLGAGGSCLSFFCSFWVSGGLPLPGPCSPIHGSKSVGSFASLCSGHGRDDDDGDDSVCMRECV